MTTQLKILRAVMLHAVIMFLFTFVTSTSVLHAADVNPPERMTYQGYLTDANGVPLGNTTPKNYDVIFRIYDDQSTGNLLWAEQQTLTVDQGYFSVLLGEGSQVSSEPNPALSTLFADATASHRFVQITVKGIGSGGGDSTILPRLRLLTSPYAFLARHAVNAANLVNNTSSQVVTISGVNVGVNQASPTSTLDVNGTASVSGKLTINGLENNGSSQLHGNVDVDDKITSARSYASTVNFSLDGSAYLTVKNISGGMNPCINWDGNDWLEYRRAQNEYNFMIASATKLQIKSSGVVVPSPNTISGYGTIPIGGIIMWSGQTAPNGWALCDGQNGTPDLRGRFVLGSGQGAGLTARTIDQTGGEETHILSSNEMPSHHHYTTFAHNGWPDGSSDREDNYYIMDKSRGSDKNYNTSDTGGGAAHNNMPPYYVLAFIMRIQ